MAMLLAGHETGEEHIALYRESSSDPVTYQAEILKAERPGHFHGKDHSSLVTSSHMT